MFRVFKICLFIILCSSKVQAQKADAIVGKWINTPKEDIIIEVYKIGAEYNARISWTKIPDVRKPIGYILLDDLEYNAEDEVWENGKIHVPSSGKTYSAVAELQDGGKLKLLGYIGMKMFGKTKYFKRTP